MNFLSLEITLMIIGVLIFFFAYKQSEKIIAWFEFQTFGTRDEILKKLELLFFKQSSEKVTHFLLFLTFIPSALVFGACVFLGKFSLALVLSAFLIFLGWKSPLPVLNFLIQRRIRIYETQMVDTLNLLSNGLRAGQSLAQSFEMVVNELPKPVSEEFSLMLQQNRVGMTLEDALLAFYERIPTEDNQMFVSSINILKETGGNLPEVFDTITEIIRERLRLQQKIETFTAQAKYQGLILFCIPFGMLLMFSVTDPVSIQKLFSSLVGYIFLVIALILNLTGGYFIYKMTQIKV